MSHSSQSWMDCTHPTGGDRRRRRLATVIVAFPDLLVSCVLVAVTVTDPVELGAVKNPLLLIVPPLAVHFTAEL